jgi:hypothetical protein
MWASPTGVSTSTKATALDLTTGRGLCRIPEEHTMPFTRGMTDPIRRTWARIKALFNR